MKSSRFLGSSKTARETTFSSPIRNRSCNGELRSRVLVLPRNPSPSTGKDLEREEVIGTPRPPQFEPGHSPSWSHVPAGEICLLAAQDILVRPTRTRPIYRVGEDGRHANITTRPAKIPIAVGEKTVQPSPPVHQWKITVRGTEVSRQAFAERTLQKR